jgi:aryl-phospho-beta-D-glucosidase BglC (GH1 family)
MNPDIFLQCRDVNIVTPSGKLVTLRGVGLGGWMNMENFITGYPGTESQQRSALLQALGEEGYRAFFDRFLDVFFGEEDAAFLASLGMNCVRLPVNYRHFEDDMNPFELKEEGFRILDRAIERCAKHRIYTVIDLHALPGFQNQHWHSDNPTHVSFFWSQKHFQDRVVHLWEALARRYADNPWVAGYNPINEPADPDGTVIFPFYQRLHKAIRAIDPDHILFLDGNRYSTEFDIFKEVWPNTIYTCHDYALPGFVDGGDYPGINRGLFIDKNALERTFLQRTDYMRRTNTPVWVGEFGPVYLGDPAKDAMRYQILLDQLEIFRKHNASWSIWTYKDIGLQGLVYADPASPYLQRIKPVLEKKARLGVDAWGSKDAGVRHIMDPLKDTLRREFPNYNPFPFGMDNWANTLVRNILLAEALVDDFKACFQGLSAKAAPGLADSFQHSSCLRRERLLDILRADAAR